MANLAFPAWVQNIPKLVVLLKCPSESGTFDLRQREYYLHRFNTHLGHNVCVCMYVFRASAWFIFTLYCHGAIPILTCVLKCLNIISFSLFCFMDCFIAWILKCFFFVQGKWRFPFSLYKYECVLHDQNILLLVDIKNH